MAKQYVRYVGRAHRRIILADAWKSIGVKADAVVWEAQNGFAVPLEVFTDNQIKRAITPDPEFVITGKDEEFEPVLGPYDMTPRELVQWHENPVDVMALLNGTDNVSTTISDGSLAAPNGNVHTPAPEVNVAEQRQLMDDDKISNDEDDSEPSGR